LQDFFYLIYSKISLGWQSNASQIASNVENLMAFALLVFKMDKLATVIPIFLLIHCFSFCVLQALHLSLQLSA